MEKDIEDIKSKTPPKQINEELKNLGYSDEGIQWCKAHEPAISSAMASISRQWKVINHSSSIGKEWGIGILMLLQLSNLTLHDNKRMPGKQMAQWHPINTGKYTNLLHILYTSFN